MRRAHTRKLSTGRSTHVRASFASSPNRRPSQLPVKRRLLGFTRAGLGGVAHAYGLPNA